MALNFDNLLLAIEAQKTSMDDFAKFFLERLSSLQQTMEAQSEQLSQLQAGDGSLQGLIDTMERAIKENTLALKKLQGA